MSTSTAHSSAFKKRDYRLGKRAEKQDETRRRIVEAAVELHGTVGPARTSVSQIAEKAGVQRHTYYAHFPEERGLFLACSSLAMERDPLPDPDSWARVPAGRARLRHGLDEIYAWYQRNETLTACVLRDAEYHALTREMAELRMRPTFDRAAELLVEGFDCRARPLVDVSLQFATWQALRRSHDPASAAALMADAVHGVPRAQQ